MFLATTHLKRVINIDRSAIMQFTARLKCEKCPRFRGTLRRLIHGGLGSVRHVRIACKQVARDRVLRAILRSSVRGVGVALSTVSRGTFG